MVLVSEVGAGRASIITYVNPVVAVTLGVVVLGESPGAGAIAGLLLILAGLLALDGWEAAARARRCDAARRSTPPGAAGGLASRARSLAV